MKFIIKNKENPILQFDATILLNDIIVEDITFVQPQLSCVLQNPDIIINNNQQKEQQYVLLEKWLKSRCLSNNDPELDEKLKKIYQLPKLYSYEHLQNYQYLAGFLQHMENTNDNITVCTTKPETVCFLYQDYRFPTVFLL